MSIYESEFLCVSETISKVISLSVYESVYVCI